MAMETFTKFCKDTCTHSDNETFDLGRVLWALGTLVFLGSTVYSLLQGAEWDAIEYGTGLGLVLAGGGLGLKLKETTEPTKK